MKVTWSSKSNSNSLFKTTYLVKKEKKSHRNPFQQTRLLPRLFIPLAIACPSLGTFAEAIGLAISPSRPPAAFHSRAFPPALPASRRFGVLQSSRVRLLMLGACAQSLPSLPHLTMFRPPRTRPTAIVETNIAEWAPVSQMAPGRMDPDPGRLLGEMED